MFFNLLTNGNSTRKSTPTDKRQPSIRMAVYETLFCLSYPFYDLLANILGLNQGQLADVYRAWGSERASSVCHLPPAWKRGAHQARKPGWQ